MNWLAHAFLSSADTDFRLGNLLADIVKGSDLDGMPPEFLAGVRCHRAIDSFTDSHPVPRRSRVRIAGEWGRFSGILIDVFYDHFLAVNWDRYADVPLPAFHGFGLSCARAALRSFARTRPRCRADDGGRRPLRVLSPYRRHRDRLAAHVPPPFDADR